MKTLFVIIGLTCFSGMLCSQINDSLSRLAEEIKIQDYVWDGDSPYRLKSIEYDIQIKNDSLIVVSNSTDTQINRNDERSISNSFHEYRAHIKNIGNIEFINILRTPKYGNPFYDSKIEIESNRDLQIFDSIYDDGTKRKTWHIPIRVYKHSDSTKFRQIVKLLNSYIKPSKNLVAPDCSVDENHEWSGKKIDAIDNINLETKIHLNGQICNELAIQELIDNYLKEQNIKGVLGYIVINDLHQLETIWTEQNNFNGLVKTVDELPTGYSYLVDNVGIMSDNQLEGMFTILKSQKWEAGGCNNKSQKSYFDFNLKNKYFKEPGDNNR